MEVKLNDGSVVSGTPAEVAEYILAVTRKKETPKQHKKERSSSYNRWTAEEDAFLLSNAQLTPKKLAKRMRGRSAAAIATHRTQLGVVTYPERSESARAAIKKRHSR